MHQVKIRHVFLVQISVTYLQICRGEIKIKTFAFTPHTYTHNCVDGLTHMVARSEVVSDLNDAMALVSR